MAFRLTRSNLSYGSGKTKKNQPPFPIPSASELARNNAAHRAAQRAGALRAPKPGEKETLYNPRTGATSVESLGGPKRRYEDQAGWNAQTMGNKRGTTPKLKWSAPKTNDVKGNARQGSQYRVAYDAAGNKYHRYSEEAGGIPAEVVKVSKNPKAKLAKYDATPKVVKGPRRRKSVKLGDAYIG